MSNEMQPQVDQTDHAQQASAQKSATQQSAAQQEVSQQGVLQQSMDQQTSLQQTASTSPSVQQAATSDQAVNISMGDLFPTLGPEDPVVAGIAHDRSEVQITLRRIPDCPGVCATVFTALAEAGVNVDMIVQAAASTGTADVSFTVPEGQIREAEAALKALKDQLGYESYDLDNEVGKIALVGVGMKTHSGIAALFFRALSERNINVLMISTSEIRISAMVPLKDLDDAVRAVHTAFSLDAEQVEAVVYGGTGR